jgi:hypothetical protein
MGLCLCLDMQTDIRYIISISQDSTQIHSQVYNTEQNKFYNIRGVYDLKVDTQKGIYGLSLTTFALLMIRQLFIIIAYASIKTVAL